MTILLGVLGSVLCGLLVARRKFVVITVIGVSMTPTYNPGDRVLVLRSARIRRGRAAVALPPEELRRPGGLVMKRIAAVPGDKVPDAVRAVVAETTVPLGTVVLIGDNPTSIDSRHWGLVPASDVRGVVVARLFSAPEQLHNVVEPHHEEHGRGGDGQRHHQPTRVPGRLDRPQCTGEAGGAGGQQ
jgi:signal peptidase I